MAGLGRGRVKRRSPPINAQFTVVARAAAVRRLRLYDPKCNRVACLRRSNEFSHGLGHRPALLSMEANDRSGSDYGLSLEPAVYPSFAERPAVDVAAADDRAAAAAALAIASLFDLCVVGRAKRSEIV